MKKSKLQFKRSITDKLTVNGILSEDGTYITYIDESDTEQDIKISDLVNVFINQEIIFSLSLKTDEDLDVITSNDEENEQVVITITDLHRLENETEEAFIWRLGQAKDSGLLDLSWDEIATIINQTFRIDESEYRTEAAYRNCYSRAKRFYEAGVFNNLDEDKYFKELQIQKQELKKERVQTISLSVFKIPVNCFNLSYESGLL